MSRKIVKSRDVVFLEDQLVDDGDEVEKASSSAKISIRNRSNCSTCSAC